MTRRLLAVLVAAVLSLTSLVAVAGAAPRAGAPADSVAAMAKKCPRAAIDRATPGRLLQARCADGYAAGKTRYRGKKRSFLVAVSDGAGAGVRVKRLRGLALSATCARPGLADSLRSVAPCRGLTFAQDDPCAAFPADKIPPDPNNPNPPYGDPRLQSSLTAMRTDLLAQAAGDDYSKKAVLCAEHTDMSARECAIAYWNPGHLPGTEQDCNFFYMRVGNEYWTGLTPIVLNQYGEYLGVRADGHDPANQHAGPHTTITSYNSAQAFLQPRGKYAAQFDLDGGALDAGDVQRQIQAALGNDVDGSGLISPVLLHDKLQVDCMPAWQGGGSSWRQVALATVPVKAGTSFTCEARYSPENGGGTAYVFASLGTPTGGQVPAALNVIVNSQKSNTLRKDPKGPFTADNVIWPNGLPEVANSQAVPFSIDTKNDCENQKTLLTDSCLHLWANPAYTRSGDPDGCNIWFTLELQSDQLLQVMAKYGLGGTAALMRKQLAGWGFAGKGLRRTLQGLQARGEAFTPHISLAKRRVNANEVPPPWGTAPAGTRDVCADADLLERGKDAITPFVPTPPAP